VVAFAAGLVAWLAERHDAGEPLPVHDHGRIVENRWRAMRHGLGGSLLDLDSGEPRPTRARIGALIDAVGPAAERLGGAAELENTRALAARNGAERQRAVAADRGNHGVVEWLASSFLP
jgi:carboxylate-amine ligase